ncbi:energy transducer TonB [Tardiphaga alba]|uniref:Energy transducer TonB n=1 Tax=Tardiphaga alba TaxID=340268 RepID=A0ABX8A9T2_9BRAD|nr:energy transducer TonB [Tardiphaga alba]QUS40508.1 energy transducer TonB [Tardiphaga alba]
MSSTRPVHHSDKEAVHRTLLRWSLAGICVLTLQGSVVYAALHWPSPAVPPADLPAAIMIELAPVPAAPDVPQENVAVGPQMVMSQASTPSEQEKPLDPAEAEAEQEVKNDVAPLPDNAQATAVLEQARPTEAKKPKYEKRKPEKPKKPSKPPQKRSTQNAPNTSAPQAADVQRAAINAAAMAGTSSSVSPSTWRSMIMAHLNRHKRATNGGARGTAVVAFTIDRSGRVLSARLAGSSGDAGLDQEAVAIARRASPVPAPPANVGSGGSILLSVPVRFGS